jgi:hypothetical protein
MSEEQILAAPGLLDACRILFGDQAQSRLDEYRSVCGAPLQLAAE